MTPAERIGALELLLARIRKNAAAPRNSVMPAPPGAKPRSEPQRLAPSPSAPVRAASAGRYALTPELDASRVRPEVGARNGSSPPVGPVKPVYVARDQAAPPPPRPVVPPRSGSMGAIESEEIIDLDEIDVVFEDEEESSSSKPPSGKVLLSPVPAAQMAGPTPNKAAATPVDEGRAARERVSAERAEHYRLAREAAEKARRERQAAERAKQQRLVAEAAEHAKREREAAEHAKREREAAEHAKREREAAEHAKREREAAEHAKREREAAEHAKREREAAEHAEQERIAAEQERVAAERAKRERLAAEATEQAERGRLTAARERLAADEDARLDIRLMAPLSPLVDGGTLAPDANRPALVEVAAVVLRRGPSNGEAAQFISAASSPLPATFGEVLDLALALGE